MRLLFAELFEYNHHHNQKLAQLFEENQGRTSERSMALFSHLLSAHHIWNSRINSVSPSYEVWEELPFEDLKAIDQLNNQVSLHILREKELEERIHYKNSRGEAFSNSIRDVLFHIINHSTYHRGQIASDLRKQGIEPVVTDYIFYKRS